MKVGIYCLDQDPEIAQSIGVYNYLKNLIEAISEQPEPGFQIVLLVTEDNKVALTPKHLPSWMSVRAVAGPFSSKYKRLWADHVLSIRYARQECIDLLHFPKGYIPWRHPGNIKIAATLHDAIILRYGGQFHDGISPLNRLYFKWATLHTLHKADALITISNFSRQELLAAAPDRQHTISTIYLGSGSTPAGNEKICPANLRSGITIMGSHRPHKATAETLRLLGQYADRQKQTIHVNVTSIERPLPDWLPLPPSLSVKFLGRVASAHLEDLIRNSRALVYLSQIEGFGLPCLESYSLGTPVCYRNTTSLAEIMEGIPCGWDGRRTEDFFSALDDTLNMPDERIEKYRKMLSERFNWSSTAKATLNVYGKVLHETCRDCISTTVGPSAGGLDRIRIGILQCSRHNIYELLYEIRHLLLHHEENPRTITCLNAHIYNLSSSNPQLRTDLLASRIIAADGMSIVWASRLLTHHSIPSRCNMTEAFSAFLASYNFPKSHAVIIGLHKNDAIKAMYRINASSTHCKVTAAIDGYLPENRYHKELESLTDIDLVLIGMGSPKSERITQIAASVFPHAVIWHIGGGTLSHLAGNITEAPAWMRKTGIQWIHRLLQEPRRLFLRYVAGNPAFIGRILIHHFRARSKHSGHNNP